MEAKTVVQNKKIVAPELRFNGFKGAWEKSLFQDVANKNVKWSITGGPFGSNLKSSDYTNVGVRILQLQNLGDGVFHDDYKIYTSEEKANELISCNIYPNDIILSKMGDPVARACFIPNSAKRFLMASDGIRLVVDEERFSKYYIFSYINHPFFRNLAISNSTGTTRKRIGLGELRIIPINHPTLPEQQKIASFLSAVDEKIQQLTQKKELLEQYKKGVMQQLFSGKLRFKDEKGKAFSKWEEKRLGEIGKIITGSTPATNNSDFYNGEYLFVSPADINNSRFIINTKTTLTELGFNEGRKVKHGSVLFVCIGSTIGKVAQSRKDCITNQQINSIEAFEDYCNDFIYSLLEFYAAKIKPLAGTQAVPQINKTDFSKIKFSFPCLEEQNKIANYLSNIDNKIESVTKQITQTQTFKKGLLQQMFV